MRKIFLFVLLILSTAFSQENKSSDKLDLFSPPNIKKFADYLFCNGDYLRAAEEYKNYLNANYSDTVEFKIGLAFSRMDKFEKAAGSFAEIPASSDLYPVARLEYLKAFFQTSGFTKYRYLFSRLALNPGFKYLSEAKSLYNFSFFFTAEALPDKNKFLDPYIKSDRDSVEKFYDWRENPPYKSPISAAVLSAVIPGLGKFYTHQYSDGIFAFLATGVLGYLAYTNFNAHHLFRAWLFTGLTAGFYGGNIYGAAASAQLFNAKINFDFINGLKLFLDSRNYFIPEINFCR